MGIVLKSFQRKDSYTFSFPWNQNENNLYQELASYYPWARSGLLPVFVNKVLLAQSHTHLFT